MIYPNKENKLANTEERNTEASERVAISIVENVNLLVQEAQQTSRKTEKKKKIKRRCIGVKLHGKEQLLITDLLIL